MRRALKHFSFPGRYRVFSKAVVLQIAPVYNKVQQHSFGTGNVMLKAFGPGKSTTSLPPPPSNKIAGGGGGKNKNYLNCPKCGEACTHVETFVSLTRFVKCEKCNHFFVVLNDHETRKKEEFETKTEGYNKPPPPPKKIYEYLNKHVIGQEFAKKVLSVAVYNHYKRIYNNQGDSLNTSRPDSILMRSSKRNYLNLDIDLDGKIDKKMFGSDILDGNYHELKLEKSNILLLGPTGSGNVLENYLVLYYLVGTRKATYLFVWRY